MHQCCSTPYEIEFDRDHAQKDLREYRSNGPKKNSKPLLDLLGSLNLTGLRILDIGGGVGAIAFELFRSGIRSAIHVDISSAYVQAFREEAANRSLSDQTKSYIGDFMDLHEKIDEADVVTLDKVICCYPNYEDLVRLSVQKASKWYALVIPRDTWWVKLVQYLESKWNNLKGKNFQTFIHPVSRINDIINKEGLYLHKQFSQREWYYAIYKR